MAAAENLGLVLTLLTLAGGASCLAIRDFADLGAWERAGGWVLRVLRGLRLVHGQRHAAGGRLRAGDLPLGMERRRMHIAPGRQHPMEPIEFALGEPGVHRGQ